MSPYGDDLTLSPYGYNIELPPYGDKAPITSALRRNSTTGGQNAGVRLPVMPPVAPMLARPVKGIPSGQLYEPKWDGFRSIVFRDGREVELGSRNERSITRYFPELVEAIADGLPARCVVDGEIVVPGGDGLSLDFWSLQQRVHPAASRVNMLAEQTPARLVVFDLLALDDLDLTGRPFAERRSRLEQALADVGTTAPIHLTPVTADEQLAARWFEQFEGAGLDGLIAKGHDLTYQPNKRVMAKVKHVRTADCVVAGYRLHRTAGDAVGSLLLGLYDDGDESVVPAAFREWLPDQGDERDGRDGPALISVGVVGAFPMAQRRQLLEELQPLVTSFDDHPWHWAAAETEARMRRGEGSRWNGKKDLSFVPLRPERVVEVRYDYMDGFRFRHTTQFVRWRPDRDPLSCGYTQLEQPEPFDLGAILENY
jgi:ATP-dependent DNA ligase